MALESKTPVPLGKVDGIKDVPDPAREAAAKSALLISVQPKMGKAWLLGLHQCSDDRVWSVEEKQMYQEISARIADALSTTLFYRDLEQNQQRLQHLSQQLFRAQEEERKRLAEEIHDELGQASLAINIGIENALFHLKNAPATITLPLNSAANLSKEIVDKMRRMQRSIYPPTLRDFGPITALRGFLDDFANIYPMGITSSIHVSDDDFPDSLRVPVFRITQEALYNAGKHSLANTISVSMMKRDDRLVLSVEDNGIGFDPEMIVHYPDNHLGLGITSMRERGEMSGGNLEVVSQPGRGTTIRCIWSLKNDS